MSISRAFLDGRESSFNDSHLGDFIPKTEFPVHISKMPDSPDFGGQEK